MEKREREKKNIKNIIDIIGLSFKKWWSNFIIVLPFVFLTIAAIIGSLLLFLLFGFIFVAIFGPEPEIFKILSEQFRGITNPETINAIFSNVLFTPGAFIYLILAFIVSFFVLGLIQAYFYSGAIAMSAEIYRGKKTNLKTMANAGKKFLWRYWLIKIIITIGIILWLFIFSLPLLLSKNVNLLWIFFVSLIPLAFIYVLFLLSEYFLVLEDVSVREAFRKSIDVVGKNYWAMLGLGILFILMSIAASFIPLVGGLITMLVLIPVQTIAFVIFAIERAYRR